MHLRLDGVRYCGDHSLNLHARPTPRFCEIGGAHVSGIRLIAAGNVNIQKRIQALLTEGAASANSHHTTHHTTIVNDGGKDSTGGTYGRQQ